VLDHVELAQVMLAHPEADVTVDFGGYHLDVRDLRYVPDREPIVLKLYKEDVRDVLSTGIRPSEAPRGEDRPGTEGGRTRTRKRRR
jgi:hypothetical protein